jgi:hypothetical protein
MFEPRLSHLSILRLEFLATMLFDKKIKENAKQCPGALVKHIMSWNICGQCLKLKV